MNELAEKRNNKVYEVIVEHPSGVLDSRIAEILKWDTGTVRSTCGILRKRGKILVKEVVNNDKLQWFLVADDTHQDDAPEQELKRATERLGKAISEFLYVALRK